MKYDYEAHVSKLRVENLADAKFALQNSAEWLYNKIATFAEDFGFDYNQVVSETKKSELLLATFAKNPTKQNVYEKYAKKIIEGFDCVESIEKLVSSGPSSLYVINGEIKRRNDISDVEQHKNIDFYIKTKSGKTIYATHKYTRITGGSQDNQYHDVLNFCKNANSSRERNTYFFAIIDGAYYDSSKLRFEPTSDQEKYAKDNYNIEIDSNYSLTLTKRQYLETIARNNTRVLSLDSFEEEVIKLDQ